VCVCVSVLDNKLSLWPFGSTKDLGVGALRESRV
jgi:hypothetical protein